MLDVGHWIQIVEGCGVLGVISLGLVLYFRRLPTINKARIDQIQTEQNFRSEERRLELEDRARERTADREERRQDREAQMTAHAQSLQVFQKTMDDHTTACDKRTTLLAETMKESTERTVTSVANSLSQAIAAQTQSIHRELHLIITEAMKAQK